MRGREGGKEGREGREGGKGGREGRERDREGRREGGKERGSKGGRGRCVWNDSCLPACHVYHVFHRSGIRHFHLACEMAPLVAVLHYVNTRVMHREVSQTIPTSSICSFAVCKYRGGRPGRFGHMRLCQIDRG